MTFYLKNNFTIAVTSNNAKIALKKRRTYFSGKQKRKIYLLLKKIYLSLNRKGSRNEIFF